jgi:hypothetical protein
VRYAFYPIMPFMGYDLTRPAKSSLHPPNCKIVTDVLIFGGLLSDVQILAGHVEHRRADFDLKSGGIWEANSG